MTFERNAHLSRKYQFLRKHCSQLPCAQAGSSSQPQPSCPRGNPETAPPFPSCFRREWREACSHPLCNTDNFLFYMKDVWQTWWSSGPSSSPPTPRSSLLLPLAMTLTAVALGRYGGVLLSLCQQVWRVTVFHGTRKREKWKFRKRGVDSLIVQGRFLILRVYFEKGVAGLK